MKLPKLKTVDGKMMGGSSNVKASSCGSTLTSPYAVSNALSLQSRSDDAPPSGYIIAGKMKARRIKF